LEADINIDAIIRCDEIAQGVCISAVTMETPGFVGSSLIVSVVKVMTLKKLLSNDHVAIASQLFVLFKK